MEEYVWFGEKTEMLLEYDEISERGKLQMISKIMIQYMEAYNEQKAKKGAEKGF
jgi:hypothetical protein